MIALDSRFISKLKPMMLSTTNLSYQYPGGFEMVFPNLECGAGETHLILGPSGSGKTTLLHLLGGLLRPKSGSIKVNDIDLGSLSGGEADKFRGQHIGLVFQQPHFVESLNVEENLLLSQRLARQPVSSEKVHEILEQLGIGEKAIKKTSELSAGEKQRLSIARALINRPAVILADEPTSALDDTNCKNVITLLEDLATQNGSALIVVTHDNRLTAYFSKKTLLN